MERRVGRESRGQKREDRRTAADGGRCRTEKSRASSGCRMCKAPRCGACSLGSCGFVDGGQLLAVRAGVSSATSCGTRGLRVRGLQLVPQRIFKNPACVFLEDCVMRTHHPDPRGRGLVVPLLLQHAGTMVRIAKVRMGVRGMAVSHCPYAKVPCVPTEDSCTLCVMRTRAHEQEAKRARVAVRRWKRAEEIKVAAAHKVDDL
jgi:hypothetical protein